MTTEPTPHSPPPGDGVSPPAELTAAMPGEQPSGFTTQDVVRNIVAGLTVSFVAISLGAAFGAQSGRGAMAGILSAGLIALITALFGGTRIQCSGPTAPMTAVVMGIVTFAFAKKGGLSEVLPGVNPDHFVNIVMIMTGAMLVLAALLRLGKFISYVPKVVISGFMNGIAVLIWVAEVKKLLGVGEGADGSSEIGANPMTGGTALNVGIAVVTLVLCFVFPMILKRLKGIGRYLPSTLVVIVILTAVVHVAFSGAQRVSMGSSDATLLEHVKSQFPTEWSFGIIKLAAFYASQLLLLAYLDTLLTALVVDKLVAVDLGVEEKTKQNKELVAQGLANAAAGVIGGIPGAQATIRSVLIIKEGATMRLAGVAVGVFVIVEMLAFQSLIAMIPSAVFAGVLIKVGYDVMDWPPLMASFRRMTGKAAPDTARVKSVAWIDMGFVLGTTVITILIDLNAAVISFLILFYVLRAAGVAVPDFDPAAGTAEDPKGGPPDDPAAPAGAPA